jgi:hypothetical protein
MGNVDARLFEKEIDYYYVTVTIRAVSKSLTASKWGDAAETNTDTAGIKCIPNVLSEADMIVREGTFKSGDIRFFFKPANSALIVNGNRILYNGHWYEITDTKAGYHVFDTLYVIEALTKKI